MKRLDIKPNNDQKIELIEGQRGLMSSNRKSERCPPVGFIDPNEVSEEVALDYLARILVAVFLHKMRNEKQPRSKKK